MYSGDSKGPALLLHLEMMKMIMKFIFYQKGHQELQVQKVHVEYKERADFKVREALAVFKECEEHAVYKAIAVLTVHVGLKEAVDKKVVAVFKALAV